uniref:Transmembrane protein 51 n=1 Tax=Geotrypetes seraphini TaxID=260995 RepID=A0A6P8NQJ2_GEOSA|nr:transmembrane protein 51 [Geotrypetes seraphini]XP_033778528.1 transmembrane protein 51 [Geotrypetes seraphini]XP_033778530.1 transmembrane protein 51 [Geotrypetes seraphini]
MAQSKSSGSQYALTALGIGMLIIGIVMAAWNLVPGFGNNQSLSQGNGSQPEPNGGTKGDGGGTVTNKQFPLAYVMIGSGLALLLLAICLNARQKKKQERQSDANSRNSQDSPVRRRAQEEGQEDEDAPRYTVPSYEEVMGTGYSTAEGTDLDRNARMSLSLPSYESLNELDGDMPTASTKTDSNKEKPARRQSSRLGRALRSLKVKRIKSDKLHLKDFRSKLADKNSSIQINIEPLTPPPHYDEKTFENLQSTATPP